MTNEFMDTPIDYGELEINYFIPKGANAKYLEIAGDFPEIKDIEKKLTEVVENPTDSLPLKELIKQNYSKGKSVIILTDDNTRPNIHTRILLPILFPKILEYGVQPEDLHILIASGTHRPPTDEEIEKKVLGSEIWAKYKKHVVSHNCDEGVKQIGISSRGTPIYLNELALKSCLIIAMTDSEYHYFAGVAGTVKQFFPGIAGRKTISINHPKAFTLETGFRPECRLGNTEGNPVIQDMKEMVETVQKTKAVFCVDAILHNKKIVELHAGDIISMHKLAKNLLNPLRIIEVDRGADLVIITTGDLGLNLYQAGKGVHAAWNAVKKGGKILLLARAEDGVGNQAYHDTMLAVKDKNLDEALEWVVANKCSEETFKIGNQKPVDLLRILKENQIDMITEMNHKELKDTFRINGIEIKGSVQETLRNYLSDFLKNNPNALIYIMSDAGIYVIPKT
ncbi:MAG TPA: lactate racemase domain-containing protein [candidate division Zixibacteria bacterium]|nr:lactate racemase domain-containing protein [candidate division Zixibacteria bacterium]